MKRISILMTITMLMVFSMFAINSFAAGKGMEHKTSPALQATTERHAAADRPLRASEVLGKNLRGERNEALGKVGDLIIGHEGEITFALVSRKEVAGRGASYTPVPWSAVTRNAQKGEFFASITKESFDKAPTFKKGEIDKMARSEFEQKVYGYYGKGTRPEMEHKGLEHQGSKPMMEKSTNGGMKEGQ